MLDIIEAYKIAKKIDNDLETTYYSEFDGKYFFCRGDSEAYVTVDISTGDAKLFNRTEEIFAPVFNGTAEPGTKEYEKHLLYCDSLNEALNKNKKIPIASSKVS